MTAAMQTEVLSDSPRTSGVRAQPDESRLRVRESRAANPLLGCAPLTATSAWAAPAGAAKMFGRSPPATRVRL